MSFSDIIVQDAAIVGTLILLEAVLSFDNAAVLAAMVRRLPPPERRKALLYGLVGAYVLRVAAILLASFLIETPILKVLGGGYLIFITVKHFINLRRNQGQPHGHELKATSLLERMGVPALWAVIIQVELVDLAFAIDQVVAAVAFTDEIKLIIIASMLGILFLRLAASLMARIMDWLPLLEHMAYIAVAVVGLKLVLAHPFFAPGGDCLIPWLDSHALGDGDHALPTDGNGTVQAHDPAGPAANGTAPPAKHHAEEGHCEVPTAVAISITLGLFGTPVLLKLLFGIPKPRKS